MRGQEGGGDQAPLLDFGHLECQSCELSVFVPSHAKHKARCRRAVPNSGESTLLLLPFPPREQWTLCPGDPGKAPGDKEAMSMCGCESGREVKLWSPQK